MKNKIVPFITGRLGHTKRALAYSGTRLDRKNCAQDDWPTRARTICISSPARLFYLIFNIIQRRVLSKLKKWS